jgi:hypothetical protein
MTYASVAVLPWSIAQENTHPFVPDAGFFPFDLSLIKR